LQGQAFDLGAWRGKTVLINFWATWCMPCRKEMPLIDPYYRAHRAQGLEVLALSMDEAGDESVVRQVASRFAFTVAMYSQVDIQGFRRIWRMPVCALVSPAGQLVAQDLFFDPPLDERALDALLRPWLRTDAGASAPTGSSSGPP
jgi:thiol-disulfide isomerase/thioredoxin